jgi:hypothetical protein
MGYVIKINKKTGPMEDKFSESVIATEILLL